MRVVVTGAGGFIGAAVLARLVAAGDDVIGVLRRPPAPASGPNLRWLVADLSDDAGLAAARAAAAEADCVVHLAALRKQWGVPAPVRRRVNVESGVALVRAMAAGRHFLFVSTAGVHGDSTGRRVGVASPLAPYDPYTASKAEAEREIRAAALEARVVSTVARPGVVYGPGDTYGMVANMARLIARRRFVVVGNGRNRLNPIYIDDLASGLARTLVDQRAADRDLLFCGAEIVSVRDLAERLARETGRRAPRRIPSLPVRVAAAAMEGIWIRLGIGREPFLTRAKVRMMTREFVYDRGGTDGAAPLEPEVGVAEGVRRTVAWLKHRGLLAGALAAGIACVHSMIA